MGAIIFGVLGFILLACGRPGLGVLSWLIAVLVLFLGL